MKTILERVEKMKSLGIIGILNQQTDAKKYIQYLYDEKLEIGKFPVYTARNFECGTTEYNAMLLLDCHFGAKSECSEVSEYYLKRFNHVINQY